MTRTLIGNKSHPMWSELVGSCDKHADWAQTPSCSEQSRVIVLVGYDEARDVDKRLTRLASALHGAEVLIVAPDFRADTPLGRALKEGRAAIAASSLLRHAPPIEALLAARRDVQLTRTLSLPLAEGSVAVPLVAWVDVAKVAARFFAGELPGDVEVSGPEAFTGEALASAVSAIFDEVLEPRKFAELRLRELDENGDGIITVDEATRFLVHLGHALEIAVDIAGRADLDGDGTISLEEFTLGLGERLRKALAAVPRKVTWHATLAHIARERWVSTGLTYAHADALSQHLATTSASENAVDTTALRMTGSTRVSDVLRAHALSLVDLFILPGRGLMTTREGRFGDVADSGLLWSSDDPELDARAVISHVEMADGAELDSRKSDHAVEVRWRGGAPTETLRFGEGDAARALEIADGRIVGVACRGPWGGLRDTMVDVMGRRHLRTWEKALFRELGALRLQDAVTVDDPNEIVCHCAGVRRGALVATASDGATTLAAIAERTRATSVCGGCTAIVEEILGSPKLQVAEVLSIESIGADFVKLRLRPIEGAPVESKAGQHIVVQARIQDRWVTRAYTLTSPGGHTEPYEITVKREEMGLFSRWLADRAASESLFRCSEPTGDVFLSDHDGGPIYAFAGGIGVTPAVALARTLASDPRGRTFHLDWTARRPRDFVFARELDILATANPRFRWVRRCSQTDGRLKAEYVAAHYPYVDGAIAFVCGPDRFIAEVSAYLGAAGWPAPAIRVEVFSSHVDDEGKVKASPRASAIIPNDAKATVAPVQHSSFFLDTRENRPVVVEAEAFLAQMYSERGLGSVLAARLEDVRTEIARTGSYTHTPDELLFGARLAWRNATRCVGRFFWQHLQVRDQRQLESEEQIFAAIVDHIRVATNGGDLVSTISIFRPGEPRIRLHNSQLVRYAGYRQSDGTFVGDPANAELTERALALGWRGAGTRFDVLPIIIQIGDHPPRWFELPPDAVLRVPIEHPSYPWFADLALEWYAIPAVSEIALDLGGVQYRCAPFNGFYMVTEIGARNFSDVTRFNLLPVVAEKMGLDTSSSSTLWKDRALVELNVAVMHSFQKRRVRMLDHHAVCDYFLQFEKQEKAAGREVYADWSWLVPPMSGSTSPIFFRSDLRNVVYKPMYGYQAPPWQPDMPPPAHEGPIPPCPHLRARSR